MALSGPWQSVELGTRALVVTLEHGSGTFGTGMPMAPIPPGVSLIVAQAVGIGLHSVAMPQKKQARFIRGHACGKGFGFDEYFP